LALVEPAKASLASEGVATLVEMGNVITTWNGQAAGLGANSKFVSSIQMAGAPAAAGGPATANPMITITYNDVAVGLNAAQKTLTLTPWMRDGTGATATAPGGRDAFTAVTNGGSGSLDWGCASATSTAALSSGITVGAAGTMLAKFAPAQCR
jgi:type IV pilus assembly protein PilA